MSNKPTLSGVELTPTVTVTETAPAIDYMARAEAALTAMGEDWGAMSPKMREFAAKQIEEKLKAEADKQAAEAKLAARGNAKHLNVQWTGLDMAGMLAAVNKEIGAVRASLTRVADGKEFYTATLQWQAKMADNGKQWRIYLSEQDHDVNVQGLNLLSRIVVDADMPDRPAK